MLGKEVGAVLQVQWAVFGVVDLVTAHVTFQGELGEIDEFVHQLHLK